MCIRDSMTADEKQKICDNIFQYITKKLDDWMDNQIFTKTSMKELGELYYNCLLYTSRCV